MDIPENNEELLQKAVDRATSWQNRANELLTHDEKGIQDELRRLLTRPMDKVILTKLIDQSFRSHDNSRVADQVNAILKQYGVPDFLSSVDRLLMQMFLGLGRFFPSLSVPKMIKKMRQDSSRAIIPGEPEALHAHLKKRKEQGVRMNINHLGEAVLGEQEARHRLATYLDDLENPEIEYISVKISTIYSQIEALAFEHSVEILTDRLTELYRVAKKHHFVRNDGTKVPKFVNLDMEEYRDIEITYAAFTRALDQDDLRDFSAGIVLQAYLPDAFPLQERLTEWARRRVTEGGSPVKLRIVKGANMEMEQVEASLFNWPLAPYDNKLDVDANYKRMVAYGMIPEHIRAVHLGIASHNLFELAYAYELGLQRGVSEYFWFEMLEGMADHVRRALKEMAGDVLLYAPVATRDEFINAIGYLIRRLDENTSEENFLRYAPQLRTESKDWQFLEERFIASGHHMARAGTAAHRTQNRLTEKFPDTMGTYYQGEFTNEPDTDWSLSGNREWAETIREAWKKNPEDPSIEIPLIIDGEEILDDRETRNLYDPNQLPEDVCVARYRLATDSDIQQAVAVATADPDGWRRKSHRERHGILSRVAMAIRYARGDLIGAAAANTGKVFTESDVEVSEAIDFAEFYPFTVGAFTGLGNLEAHGKGVGVVISPWNFPIAIPCGGIAAALAAGNTVLFKPASNAVLVAWQLCQCFWSAGVSQKTLQFVPCSGGSTGKSLTSHPDIDFVILTGGTETGLKILAADPGTFLAAETGGKNATIVTAMSDRDQAVKNIIHSAFSNCGQKCSATSLLILEQEVHEDDKFKQQLKDAVESYAVGSAWDFHNKMGPLIHPPAGDLKQAFDHLEKEEAWLLAPRMVDNNPNLWTPAIKWGVQPGSYTYGTEFFGPLLGVMGAKNLDDAIELANGTGYGLTSGLESLDRREQRIWKSRIKAGNLYINRGTTGAITLRQPFGGMGKSAIGPAIKAGSPNYVAQFMEFLETDTPSADVLAGEYDLMRLAQEWKRDLDWGLIEDPGEELHKTVKAIPSYLYWYERVFSREQDYFHLRGQDNILRYLPLGKVVVRLHEEDGLFDTLARIAATRITRNGLIVSLPPGLESPATDFLAGRWGKRALGNAAVVEQSDDDLAESIPDVQRIRYASPERVPETVLQAAAETGFYIARAPVLMQGRIELLHYLINQAVCDNYHRYGNLGERAILDP